MVNRITKLKAIAAVSPEGIIASMGSMPWHVSEDLKRFKQHTQNQVVIYGKGTWESFNKKPLPNRINILISTSVKPSDIADTTVIVYCDLHNAIDDCRIKYSDKDIWIIGGASIYSQTLPIVDELYLTIINKEQVRYHELHDNDILFFPGFPDIVNEMFNLKTSDVTKYATYQKYIRKSSSYRNPTRPVFSKANAKPIKNTDSRARII